MPNACQIDKIGDLGLMDTVKTEQKNDYMNEQNERGTPGWLAPVSNPLIGGLSRTKELGTIEGFIPF
jgi:hypothetical protein